ncbi:unnamed protein product [Sphagnum balticum]
MEEPSNKLGEASKSFVLSDSAQPDLLVEKHGDGNNPLSSTNAAVIISGADGQKEQTTIGGEVAFEPRSSSSLKSPYPASTSNNIKLVLDSLLKGIEKAKKPRNSYSFLLFVIGLFLCAMAGNYSNGFVSEFFENRGFYSPQYVKDFCEAEGQVLSYSERAFSGMREALTNGEIIEPQSRRFAELTASFARRLDSNGSYLEAKSYWAKAAVPSDIASPELREFKRAFLIDEAGSEHLALTSQLKKDVDLNLLDEVEKAAGIFQRSSVDAHDWRAFRAFVTAGSLAADANDFERAYRDFNSAQKIANGQWIGFGFDSESLLEAKWLAQLQEDVQRLLVYKGTLVLLSQYKPADWSFNYDDNHKNLKARNFEQLEKTLDESQKQHLQDIYGYTIVTDSYAIGHSWSDDDPAESYRQILKEWSIAYPRSARPLIAASFSLTSEACELVDGMGDSTPSDSTKRKVYQLLYESAQDLQSAQILQPDVTYEPSLIEAILRNFYAAQKLAKWSYTSNKLVSDLHSASIVMTGDESQPLLNEFTYGAERLIQFSYSTETLVEGVSALADKIGGRAGDEFYTRAMWRLSSLFSTENMDKARFKRGADFLQEKFGAFHDVMP